MSHSYLADDIEVTRTEVFANPHSNVVLVNFWAFEKNAPPRVLSTLVVAGHPVARRIETPIPMLWCELTDAQREVIRCAAVAARAERE
jgi:hypothetical protein